MARLQRCLRAAEEDSAAALLGDHRAEEDRNSDLALRAPGPLRSTLLLAGNPRFPIRQALVRLKFGAEADKSAEASKLLQEEERPYEIVLSGPMGMFLRGQPADSAKALSEVSFLSSKRTGEIKAVQIQVGKPGKTMDVLFAFPRSMPFTADDKEVEFITKLGTSTLKYKFKLKDMVVNGKLEM